MRFTTPAILLSFLFSVVCPPRASADIFTKDQYSRFYTACLLSGGPFSLAKFLAGQGDVSDPAMAITGTGIDIGHIATNEPTFKYLSKVLGIVGDIFSGVWAASCRTTLDLYNQGKSAAEVKATINKDFDAQVLEIQKLDASAEGKAGLVAALNVLRQNGLDTAEVLEIWLKKGNWLPKESKANLDPASAPVAGSRSMANVRTAATKASDSRFLASTNKNVIEPGRNRASSITRKAINDFANTELKSGRYTQTGK
ncbi:MAG TPA: hypothetical protein VIH99_07360 [Bdellovibrionota bacterium]|jgi:hypothetical protein